MSRWIVTRNQTTQVEEVYDVEVTDAVNRFGRRAVVWIDDQDGTRFEDFPRGTRVDIDVRPGDIEPGLTIDAGDTYDIASGTSESYRQVNVGGELNVAGELNLVASDRITMFAGYVVERREVERRGADVLEVEVYSFDHFLRRNQIAESLSGQTITEALETVITDYTPVDYDANQVTVVDEQTLTRSYRGVKVENFLSSVASKSGDESYGVDNSLTFFFRPEESGSAPRGIDNTEWIDYDIPEVGKESLNEVTVFFDDGDKSVTVDRGDDKLDLQDSLNTNDPVNLSTEVSEPDITALEDARDVANEILDGREPTLTGTVTTFSDGLYEAEPGDVISITIGPRGIDSQFRIAEQTYRWGEGTVDLTIVEKRGNQDDLLVRMSDTLKQVELENVDRDATGNVVTSSAMTALVDVTGDVDGTTYDSAGVTNDGRDAIRDGWTGAGNITVADIAVGNGTTAFSRSDSDLENELARASVSESLPDATTAEYTASIAETDVREIGLFAGDGTLLARATVPDTAFTSPVSVTVTLTVSNDGSVDLAVITDSGQTVVRDIIADNSPNLPTQYAYGDDGSTPTTGDTALGNQLAITSIDELLVQDADTQTEWQDITSLTDTDATTITSGGELTSQQTSFTVEAEDFDRDQGSQLFISDTDLSGDGTNDALVFSGNSWWVEWDFTIDYTIQSGDFEIYYRNEGDDSGGTVPSVNWYLDGTLIGSTNTVLSLGWDGVYSFTGETPPEIDPGTHTIRAENAEDGGGGARYIDVVAPLDDAYSYTFDNTVNSDRVDGPELYPLANRVEFNEVQTRRDLDSATATQVWNDVTNGQYIELSNDGGSTWIRTNNSQTASASFGSLESQVQTAIGISRFGSRTGDTPQTGFNTQSVDSHVLDADIQAIFAASTGVAETQAIFAPGVLAGSTLREGGQLASDNTLLTRSVFADIDVLANQRVLSNERLTIANP